MNTIPPKKRPIEEDGGGGSSPPKRMRKSWTSQSQITHSKAIIEKITLVNFMCHSNFSLTLKPNVNFLCGKNGSGKSAILNAIILVLNGKASATSRNKSAKDFIQTGKSYCKITLHLQNQGPDAYKPELYGPSIIIERKILKGGNSEYKLRNADKNPVSSSVNELRKMLSHHNIMVDNPLNILNQDTSREFLTSLKPTQRYNFFNKSTNLQKVQEHLVHTSKLIKGSRSFLDKKRSQQAQLETQLHELEIILEDIDKIPDQQLRVTQLKKDWTFNSANILSRIIERIEYLRDTCHKKHVDLEHEQEENIRKKNENEILRKEKADILRNKKKTFEELEANYEKITAAHFEAKKNVSRQKINESNEDREVKNKEELLSFIKQQIFNKAKQDQEKLENDRKTKNDRLSSLHDKIQYENDKFNCLDGEEKKFEDQRATLDAQAKEISTNQRSLQYNQTHFVKTIRELESEGKDRISKFGKGMRELIRCISTAYANGQFKEKPRGPLGTHLKLKDAQFSTAVETCLKTVLGAFAVGSFEDLKVLRNIIDEHQKHYQTLFSPTIITVSFSNLLHNIAPNVPKDTPHPTVFDVLEIDDVVVSNALIDQTSIESILLIKENSTARSLLMRPASVPKHCLFAFTETGDKVYPAPGFRYYSNRYKCKSLLQENTSIKMQQFKQNLADSRRTVSENAVTLKNIQKRLNDIKEQLNQIKNQKGALSVHIEQYKMETDIIQKSIREEGKQESVEVLQLSKEKHEQEYNDVKLRYATQHNITEDLKAKLANLTEKQNILKAQKQEANTACSNCKTDLFALNAELEKLDKAIKENGPKMVVISNNEKKYKQVYEQFKGIAAEVNVEITDAYKTQKKASSRPISSIKNEIAGLEKQIKEDRQKRPSRAEVVERLEECRNNLKELVDFIDPLDTHIKAIEIRSENRLKEFLEIRKQTVLATDSLFAQMLNRQGCRGNLLFNHAVETLDLKVSMIKDAKANADLKSLSGGERSFTTIAFFLSLWTAIDAPFRILDEYDVFMDSVNRHNSMKLMLEITRALPNSQFIFLTPQSLNHIPTNARDIHIFKMEDPSNNSKPAKSKQQ